MRRQIMGSIFTTLLLVGCSNTPIEPTLTIKQFRDGTVVFDYFYQPEFINIKLDRRDPNTREIREAMMVNEGSELIDKVKKQKAEKRKLLQQQQLTQVLNLALKTDSRCQSGYQIEWQKALDNGVKRVHGRCLSK